jgi:hypothetical protein
LRRRYLGEGNVEMRYNGKISPRFLVLFNNLILICKERKKEEKTVFSVSKGNVFFCVTCNLIFLAIVIEDNVSFFESLGGEGFKIILNKEIYEFMVTQEELEGWMDNLAQALRVTSNSLQPIVQKKRRSGTTFSMIENPNKAQN